MHLIGAYVWYKFTSPRTHEVVHRNFYGDDKIFPHVIVFFGSIILGIILDKIGGSNPYLDAFVTFSSLYATYLLVKRHGESWIMFIVINVISMLMWRSTCDQCSSHLTTAVMWGMWSINAVYGLIMWKKY